MGSLVVIFKEYNALCQEHIQDFFLTADKILKGISIAVWSLQK